MERMTTLADMPLWLIPSVAIGFGAIVWGFGARVARPAVSIVGFTAGVPLGVMLRDAIRTVHSGNAVLAPADLSTLLDSQFRAAAAPPASYTGLTDKEREVFAAVARGLSNQEIAGQVFLSESTVKTHVGAILRKLGLRDRVQIVVFAHEHGLAG